MINLLHGLSVTIGNSIHTASSPGPNSERTCTWGRPSLTLWALLSPAGDLVAPCEALRARRCLPFTPVVNHQGIFGFVASGTHLSPVALLFMEAVL